MARRSSVRIGDLKAIGQPRFAGAMDSVQRAPSWLVISGACVTTLMLLAAAAGAWLAWHDRGLAPTRVANPFAQDQPSTRALQVFPPWVEVPYLSGARPAETGLPSTITDAQLQSPQPPLLDAGRRVPEVIHIRQASLPTVEIALVAPYVTQPLPPETTLRAWSPRPRPVIRPVITIHRPPEPDRDAEQTASVVVTRKPGRTMIDTGAALRTSLHRARSDPERLSRAPAASSSPWTLPPALAPAP